MDRYKFRGKVDIEVTSDLEEHIKDGWVYGNLVGRSLIVGDVIDLNDDYFNTEFWISVKPSTVGQYIGTKDINGVDIYEGDLVEHSDYDNGVLKDYYQLEIVYCKEYLQFGFDGDGGNCLTDYKNLNVVGNIHDNKEILEG